MQTEFMREKTFNLRMSLEDWARLEALVAHHEMSAAQLIRMLIKREHETTMRPPGSPKTIFGHGHDIITELVPKMFDPMRRHKEAEAAKKRTPMKKK